MRVILFYNGKTGFTKRYADWIAQELNCEVKPFKDFEKTKVGEDDLVIFGSRIYAGRIERLNKIKSRVKDNLIVFASGATPITAENSISKIWAENFTETEREAIPHFYMQSGLNYEKMGFIDRSIMKNVAKIMGKQKGKTADEAGFAEAIRSSYDISSREYIIPLIQCVKDKADAAF